MSYLAHTAWPERFGPGPEEEPRKPAPVVLSIAPDPHGGFVWSLSGRYAPECYCAGFAPTRESAEDAGHAAALALGCRQVLDGWTTDRAYTPTQETDR